MITFYNSLSPSAELRLFTIAALCLALWSIVLSALHRASSSNVSSVFKAENSATGIHPSHYPITLKDVILIPEDPTHYRIYDGYDDSEWQAHFPPGGGRVRLGPTNQTYELTMFHELRCLGAIRHAMAAQSAGSADNADFLQGCFNYLRELILCRADVTLEDVISADLSVNHAYPHICRDWTALHAALGQTEG